MFQPNWFRWFSDCDSEPSPFWRQYRVPILFNVSLPRFASLYLHVMLMWSLSALFRSTSRLLCALYYRFAFISRGFQTRTSRRKTEKKKSKPIKKKQCRTVAKSWSTVGRQQEGNHQRPRMCLPEATRMPAYLHTTLATQSSDLGNIATLRVVRVKTKTENKKRVTCEEELDETARWARALGLFGI